MNHGNGQSGQGHDGSLYGYGNAQDDFSTPFSHDGTSQQSGFADTGSFMGSNYNSHFDQQMNAEPQEPLGNDYYHQSSQPGWQQSQFFDPSQLGSYQSLGESSQTSGFGSTFNPSQLNTYNDIHETSSFPSFTGQPSFEEPPRQQSAMGTINPHAIQTPSDFVYQQPVASQAHNEIVRQQSAEPLGMANIQSARPSGPQRRFFDTDLTQAIDAATPKHDKQGWFSVRQQSQYKAPADVEPFHKLKFLSVSAEAFDSAEGRVMQPPRRQFASINELEARLRSLLPGKYDAKTKSLLESKITKARTLRKSKTAKGRKLGAAIGPSLVGARSTANLDEVSDDESSSSSSEDESDYASDSDEFIEEEPSPLPSSRPENPAKAQEYDIIKTVWARDAMRIGPDDVKRRLAAYLDIAKKTRAVWRAAAPGDITAKRKEFETMLRLTVKHGHRNFIESVDQLVPLASILSAAVTEILKANAYGDGLLEAILELIVKKPNIDQTFLKTTKLDKYKDRILKKAQGRTKILAGAINAPSDAQAVGLDLSKTNDAVDSKVAISGTTLMARSNSSQSQTASKGSGQGLAATQKLPATGADVKKSLGAIGPTRVIPAMPIKSVAPAASTIGLQSKTAPAAKSSVSKPGEKNTPATNGNVLKTTIRQIVPTKTSSLLQGLQSASKKPAAPANPVAKPATPKPSTPVQKDEPPPPKPKSTFSFASTLANIGKTKEEPKKANIAEDRAPETEEERAKRLRKEARRKLRVKWKPDSDLCAIRIFDHRQDDETEHEEREVADAADLKSEGQAFKRQLMRDNVSGLEPEDDEEQNLIEWYDPRPTDFASVYERKPGDQDPPPQNVETRANGQIKLRSEETETQQQREQDVMIEMYQSIRDVPPCPKEPADPFNGKVLALQDDFGAIKNCGTKPHIAVRLEDRNQQLLRQYGHRANIVPEATPQPAADISSLLAMLGQSSTPAQPQYQPPQQYAPVQAPNPYSTLLNQFAGPQPQAIPAAQTGNSFQDAINLFNSIQGTGPAPSAPMPSVHQQPAVPSADLSSILASLTGSVAQTTTQPQAAMAQPQAQPQGQPETAPPGIDPSLIGWLAQYNSSNIGAPQMQPPQPPTAAPQPSWPNYGGTSGAGQAASPSDWLRQMSAANANNSGNHYAGNERKRGYDDDGRNDMGGNKKKKKPFTGPPRVPCKFYKEGTCHKGSECTYIHDGV